MPLQLVWRHEAFSANGAELLGPIAVTDLLVFGKGHLAAEDFVAVRAGVFLRAMSLEIITTLIFQKSYAMVATCQMTNYYLPSWTLICCLFCR
jgi:hypothetical protein